MSRLPLILALSVLSFASAASATSLVATTDTIGASLANTVEGTSDLSSDWDDDKIVLAARDDAASFVASAGEIRGVRLEAALQHIRQQRPQLQATDLQLAQSILGL